MPHKRFSTQWWRKVGIISGILMFLGFLLLVFYPVPEDFLKVGPPEMKTVEMENVSVVGYKKGKRSFEVYARYVWTPRSTDRATLENIYDGAAYDNGRQVLADLQARRLYADSASDELMAQEGVRATVIRKKQKDTDEQQVQVWAENLTYIGQQKKTKVFGTIRLTQKDAAVYADTAEIDHSKDIVVFREPFKIVQKNILLTAKTLTTHLNEERFLLEGHAHILRKKERYDTENVSEREVMVKKGALDIKADLIDFWLSHNKARGKLLGHIVVVQQDKKAFADEGFYDEQKDYVELRKSKTKQAASVHTSSGQALKQNEARASGQAGLIMDKTDWLLDEDAINKLKNPKTRESFSRKTMVLGDSIRMRVDKKDAFVQGNVKVTQQGKTAYADRAYYRERLSEIRLYGSVRFQQDNGTWLSADEAVVSLKDNTFHAVGEVQTNIILNK